MMTCDVIQTALVVFKIAKQTLTIGAIAKLRVLDYCQLTDALFLTMNLGNMVPTPVANFEK